MDEIRTTEQCTVYRVDASARRIEPVRCSADEIARQLGRVTVARIPVWAEMVALTDAAALIKSIAQPGLPGGDLVALSVGDDGGLILAAGPIVMAGVSGSQLTDCPVARDDLYERVHWIDNQPAALQLAYEVCRVEPTHPDRDVDRINARRHVSQLRALIGA